MSNHREAILRDLEYISGGITAVKTLCSNQEKNSNYYQLFDEWQDILCSIIDMIEGDYKNAEDT